MERDRRFVYSPEMTQTARRLRQEETPAEKRLWKLLRGGQCDGVRFRRQVPAGQYVLDFYCASVRLAIEIDGSIHDVPTVQVRELEREEALRRELGITFLRLSNEQVLGTDDAALLKIIAEARTKAAQSVAPWSDRPSRRR